MNPDVGSLIGVYRLDQKLGEGGMGAVWKAFHVKLQKHVALKVLPAHFTRDANLVARFEQEMVAVGKVDHPNLVRAMDAGEFQGLHYLVMEYVDGADLSEFVKLHGPLPLRQACDFVRQAALGLHAAHKLGLVHRDIKPSNLFLTKPPMPSAGSGQGGVVKILDLGLARLAGDASAADQAGLTGTGVVMGTPDYMAPEQWDDTHLADSRADLYALGCTLFHLLVGRPPFGDGAHASLLKKMAGHVHGPIPDLRKARRARVVPGISPPAALLDDVPDAVDAVYRLLMAKRPEGRIQTADELASLLAPVVAHDIDRLAREGRTFRRGHVPSSLCCPSLATIITGLYPHRQDRNRVLQRRPHDQRSGDVRLPAPAPEMAGASRLNMNHIVTAGLLLFLSGAEPPAEPQRDELVVVE